MVSPKSKSLSMLDETSKGSGSSESYASRNCPGLRATLPGWVSDWKRYHVERVLHVFYEKNTSWLPPQLLEKIPKMKKITSQQQKYIDVLGHLNFGPNPVSIHKKIDCTWNYQETLKRLEEVLLEAKSTISKESLLFEFGPKMEVHLMEYIEVLKDVVKKRYKDWVEEENEDEFKKPHICQETYSDIVSVFAKLCGLKVRKGSTDNQSKWINLRGNEKVISKPDFRFHSRGSDFQSDSNHLITVIEVKSKYLHADDQNLKRKQQEPAEIRAKRRRTTNTHSSSSTLTSGLHAFQTQEKPYIEKDVGTSTLGQHAGELLLDLNDYVKSLADVPTASMLYMPGMIVDHTRVYLTLLEISAQHYKKLTGTEQLLTGDDKAAIYYSVPLDIMDEECRRILISSFVSLNNIESLFK